MKFVFLILLILTTPSIARNSVWTYIPGTVAWTPCSESSKLWNYDFSDTAKISPGSITDGTAITSITDTCASHNGTSGGVNQKPLWKSAIKNSLGVARFDGNDYLTIATLGSNQTTFTVAFEIYISTAANFDCFLCSNTAPTGSVTWEEGATNSLNAWIGGVGTTALTGSNSFSASAWHRVVMTYTSGTMVIYIDGVSSGTSTTASRFIEPIMYIGDDNANGFGGIRGDIGECAGWSADLGATGAAKWDAYITAKWGT